MPPPRKFTFASPNGRIRAVSDPKAGTKIEDVKNHKVLWRLSNWYRRIYVADNGKYVVTMNDDLIPTDFTNDLVLFTFWAEGKRVRDITIKEIAPERRVLEKTASHYSWGGIEGFDLNGRLKVKRADGKTFLFDVATGKRSG